MNTSDKCLHNCVCQKKEIYGGICTDLAEKPRFKPGDKVWVVLRTQPGEVKAWEENETGPWKPFDTRDYMVLAESAGVVVTSSLRIDGETRDAMIARLLRETRKYHFANVLVFPADDCYATRNEAWEAYWKEVENEQTE